MTGRKIDDDRRAPVDRKTLSSARRRLAGKHLPLARRVAGWFAWRCPAVPADWQAEAEYGLCRAALSYRKGGGASFRSWAWYGVRMACCDAYRREVARGFSGLQRTRTAAVQVSLDGPGRMGADLLSDDLPIGWEVDSEDTVLALCRRLPACQAELVRRVYLGGATVLAAGRAVGLMPSRSRGVLAESLREIRETV